MEAISKQRFDAPPAAAANGTAEGAGGTGRRRAGSRVLRRLVPRLARRQPSPVPADSHAAVIALQARQQLQQHEERRHDGGAAAMSPARPQATAQPQGSVQSDMAAAGNRRRAASGKQRTAPWAAGRAPHPLLHSHALLRPCPPAFSCSARESARELQFCCRAGAAVARAAVGLGAGCGACRHRSLRAEPAPPRLTPPALPSRE